MACSCGVFCGWSWGNPAVRYKHQCLAGKTCFGGYVQFVPLHSIFLKFLLVANEDVRWLLCSGPGMLREIPPQCFSVSPTPQGSVLLWRSGILQQNPTLRGKLRSNSRLITPRNPHRFVWTGFQHLKLKPCILNSHATTHCTLPKSCPLYSILLCYFLYGTVLQSRRGIGFRDIFSAGFC